MERLSLRLYEKEQADKVNCYEVDNVVSFYLFLIYKIIKDYSYYFDKKPDLEKIYLAVKKYKK